MKVPVKLKKITEFKHVPFRILKVLFDEDLPRAKQQAELESLVKELPEKNQVRRFTFVPSLVLESAIKV